MPSVVEVKSALIIDDASRGGYALSERPIVVPYLKDYDGYGQGRPLDWPRAFDVSQWAFWIAIDGDDVVGGAAVVHPCRRVLADWEHGAVLWDIRVRESHRRQGIGKLLFRWAAEWAKGEHYDTLVVETQNVNVGACRFYERMGCELRRIDRTAYAHCPGLDNEIMLIWELNLSD
ncbi:MAG TPA: GNAT family N-acetyltransferase [Pirellulales bacterium]